VGFQNIKGHLPKKNINDVKDPDAALKARNKAIRDAQSAANGGSQTPARKRPANSGTKGTKRPRGGRAGSTASTGGLKPSKKRKKDDKGNGDDLEKVTTPP
jgi:hypothetical protein